MLETLAEDIKVVGIAYDGEQATGMVDILKPDLILMDVRMPILDGVKATKRIKQKYPEQKIVMLTTFVDDTYVESALNYGADGYLLKNIKPNELIDAINAVHSGSVLLSPDLVSLILRKSDVEEDYYDSDAENLRMVVKKMSSREKEILSLIAKGYNNHNIAEALFLSEPTVRNYISRIYAKIGSKDRLEVMAIAKTRIWDDLQ
jgi:DNA-binding NarL/FixJ family response regulator